MLRRPARPRGPALLRDLRPVLPDVLDVLHGQASSVADWVLFWADHLAVLFLPVVFLHFCLSFPERRLRGLRAVARPRALHARPRAGGGGGGEPVLFATGRETRDASGGSPRPSTAASRSTSPSSSRLSFVVLLDSYRRTRSSHRAPADEVAGLGHGRGRAALPRLLRDPLRAGPRAAAGHGAGRLHPARPPPPGPGLRGGEAPPDGRGADLPAHPRLHPGGGGDPGDLAPHRRPHERAPGRTRSRTPRSSRSSRPWS